MVVILEFSTAVVSLFAASVGLAAAIIELIGNKKE